ncbi:EpsG family protein [Azohydromonas sediminis]|uniref:EpsG family protein n=1 Tax=Azohydromonas sediminis TaxID=2259674 RepID=UPI000E647B70|nr:EpsG family protein [Azohydromonas sediminis]
MNSIKSPPAWPGRAAGTHASNAPLFTVPARRLWYVLCVVVAATVAGFGLLGPSVDLENYRMLFDWVAETDFAELALGSDPGYLVLSRLAYLTGLGFQGLLFAIALATCAAKATMLWRLPTDRAVLVGLYASYLFWLHEYTQIRIALALGLVMLGIYVVRRGRWLLFIAAVTLHASALAVVLLYAATRSPRRALLGAFLVLAALYFIGALDGLILNIATRVAFYSYYRDAGEFDQLNIFSLMPMAQGLMILLALHHRDRLPEHGRMELTFAVVGLLSFYGLSFLPVLAFRTYELFIPFFLILVSRLWRYSVGIRLLGLIYIALGLRASFMGPASLLALI